MSIDSIEVTTIDGTTTTMGDWAGHLRLIVNVASECGFTRQYEGLEDLFQEYSPRGLFVIGVPCNQFGGQEPGTNEEIQQFCQRNFGVSFPLLAKTDVNGPQESPLFTELKKTADDAGESGDIAWNFEKFLVDDSGEVIARFRSKVEPDDDALIEAIEENLPI